MPKREQQSDRQSRAVMERQRIRAACGGPPYEMICKIALTITLGVEGSSKYAKPSLSKTTVGNFFTGAAQTLSWDSVGLILQACYQHAKDSGLMPDVDPAAEARTSWATLTNLTYPDSPQQGNSESGSRTHPPSGNTGGASTPMGSSPVDEFSAEQRWYFNTYGQPGIDLYRASSAGNSESAYRLGVVLAADRQPRKARKWLAAASDMSHSAASQLLGSDVTSKAGQALAAEHAYRLGYNADHGGGDRDTAIFYYTPAANRRHSDAAYHLAHLFLGRGEIGTAARWFAVASEGENMDARRQLQKITAGA